MNELYKDKSKCIEKVLVSKDEIDAMVARLGKQITEDYKDKDLFVVGVLKGGFVFMSDLVRAIDLPLDMDFISVSSYGASTTSSGVVRLIKDIDKPIAGKDILIIEDIVDSGLTLSYLKDLLARRNPASIKICTAFDKPYRRTVELKSDYVGVEIPDEYVVGYGLDIDGAMRNIPELCVLKRSVYEG